MQDRFHALLKRRLEHEIQQNPPLFPWESEIHDYEADRAPVLLWLNQLKTLNLPVAVPESVLTHLLQRCQETLHSSLLEGAKLIRAVEELFPNQPQALNHLAGLVMASPARSGAIAPSTPEVNYPANYDAAAPMQQMVLSLLAAREILGTLTLTVSSVQPIVERQWLTELGLLTLQAEYEFGQLGSRLRLKGRLPIGGSLLLHGQGLEAIAHRSDAGVLSVELFDIQPNQPYVLEVQLTEHESTPLIFSVYAAEA
ncbi:PatU [Leptolyngbya sp. FACHB-36]|uniref:PatU n=1 Tax=Leptolyngbya sp. FACHB-36 TaxID=2692808 RepID=UPI001680A470|nr:PatU [Leptolyngbya sp. FACHB-36]MBD2020075.1 PatU [Leptolyngbya sp. FACHB-36]